MAAKSRKLDQSSENSSPAMIAKTSDVSDMWFGLTLLSLFAAGESILSASPR
jgi:hypothetical protein